MKDYSSKPFFTCLGIYLVNTILTLIFLKSSNVYAILITGIIAMSLIIFVNERAQIRRENEES
tara:strand:+ start:894 stop:1082 length:189 start_codon:yes stop_codon:yes gene_type:complete